MKCQICNKKEANIVFTQIVNNEKIVLQICTDCAKEKGLSIEMDSVAPPPSSEFFLGAIVGKSGEKEDKEVPDLTCNVCSLTYAEFKKTGLFGCDACHEAYGTHIENLLQQIHGTVVHEGREPTEPIKEIEVKHVLRKLRTKLKKYIEVEEYEKAAKLRDQIAELEKGKNTQ